MTFNEENIGKIVQVGSHNISVNGGKIPSSVLEPIPEFAFIVGYHYIKNRYVVSNSPAGTKNMACFSVRNKVYSADEAIAILDEHIAQLQQYKNDGIVFGEKLYLKVWNETPRKNHKQELVHLSNAYYETYTRLNNIPAHLEYLRRNIEFYAGKREHAVAQRKMIKEEMVLLNEQRQLQKAMRRLNKRFVFFFGEDAERVKTSIQKKQAPLNNFASATAMAINREIKQLEESKRTIIRATENLNFPANKK